MSFAQTYEAYLAQLDQAPAALPITTAVAAEARELTYSVKGVKKTHAIKEVNYPEIPSSETYKTHAKAMLAFRTQVQGFFGELSPSDRRKLSALFNAGATGSSVRLQYAALPEGSSLGALASAATLRAGMAAALQEKVELEAARW